MGSSGLTRAAVDKLEPLLAQFDRLVVFLALNHEEVFRDLVRHEGEWLPMPNGGRGLADLREFESYRMHVSHGAFLLGYAYFEAFLSDLARLALRRYPGKLSPDKQLTYKEVLEATQAGGVVDFMIEREIRSIFGQSMTQIVQYFQKRLQLELEDAAAKELVEASLIRNCLLHNGGVVDQRLADASPARFSLGNEIALSSDDVHRSGMTARVLARMLWNKAVQTGYV